MADNDVATVRLTVRQWSLIDGTVDNTVSLAAVDGEDGTVEVGTSIRQAGWNQVPWVADEWPPMDQEIEISLSREQWWFAMGEVESANARHERKGRQEELEAGRRLRDVVALQLD